MSLFLRARRAVLLGLSLILLGFSGVFVMSPVGVDAKTFPCPSGRATYTAARNDSWSRIADKVGVSMKSLLRANKASSGTMLLIGDVVCLPKSVKAEAGQQTAGRQELRLDPPVTVYPAKKSRAIIKEVFPPSLHRRAIAIAQRESRMNAAGYSWCCVGLFQLNWWSHREWLTDMGITSPQQLLDARVNAEAALALYKRSGSWTPWE
jgi:LysM repeat protein